MVGRLVIRKIITLPESRNHLMHGELVQRSRITSAERHSMASKVSSSKNGSRAGALQPSHGSITAEQGCQIFRRENPQKEPHYRFAFIITLITRFRRTLKTRRLRYKGLSPHRTRAPMSAITVRGRSHGCCRERESPIDWKLKTKKAGTACFFYASALSTG